MISFLSAYCLFRRVRKGMSQYSHLDGKKRYPLNPSTLPLPKHPLLNYLIDSVRERVKNMEGQGCNSIKFEDVKINVSSGSQHKHRVPLRISFLQLYLLGQEWSDHCFIY